jgi:hypothetical protein
MSKGKIDRTARRPLWVEHCAEAGERIMPIAGQAPVGSGSRPRFAPFAERTAATAYLARRFG